MKNFILISLTIILTTGFIYSQSERSESDDFWFIDSFTPVFQDQPIEAKAKKTPATIIKKEGNKYGVVNKDGQTIIPYAYDLLTTIIKDRIAIVKKNGRFGVIDTSGKALIPINLRFANPLTGDLIVGQTMEGITFLYNLDGNIIHRTSGGLQNIKVNYLSECIKVSDGKISVYFDFKGNLRDQSMFIPEVPEGRLGYYYSSNTALPTGGTITSIFTVESKKVSLDKGKIFDFDPALKKSSKFNFIAIIEKGGYNYFLAPGESGYSLLPFRLKQLKKKNRLQSINLYDNRNNATRSDLDDLLLRYYDNNLHIYVSYNPNSNSNLWSYKNYEAKGTLLKSNEAIDRIPSKTKQLDDDFFFQYNNGLLGASDANGKQIFPPEFSFIHHMEKDWFLVNQPIIGFHFKNTSGDTLSLNSKDLPFERTNGYPKEDEYIELNHNTCVAIYGPNKLFEPILNGYEFASSAKSKDKLKQSVILYNREKDSSIVYRQDSTYQYRKLPFYLKHPNENSPDTYFALKNEKYAILNEHIELPDNPTLYEIKRFGNTGLTSIAKDNHNRYRILSNTGEWLSKFWNTERPTIFLHDFFRETHKDLMYLYTMGGGIITPHGIDSFNIVKSFSSYSTWKDRVFIKTFTSGKPRIINYKGELLTDSTCVKIDALHVRDELIIFEKYINTKNRILKIPNQGIELEAECNELFFIRNLNPGLEWPIIQLLKSKYSHSDLIIAILLNDDSFSLLSQKRDKEFYVSDFSEVPEELTTILRGDK